MPKKPRNKKDDFEDYVFEEAEPVGDAATSGDVKEEKINKDKPKADEGHTGEDEPAVRVKTAAEKKEEKKKKEAEKRRLEKQKEEERLKKLAEQQAAKEERERAKAEKAAAADAAKRQAAGGEPDDAAASEQPQPGAGKKKGKKEKGGGLSAAQRKLLAEELERKREDEERIKRAEEEAKRLEEELRRKQEEEERLEQERKLQRKQEEKQRIEQLKKEGKYLTKAQREKQKKLEAARELLLKNALIPAQQPDLLKPPVVGGEKSKERKKEDADAEKKDEDKPTEKEPDQKPDGEPAESWEEEAEEDEDWEAAAADESSEDDVAVKLGKVSIGEVNGKHEGRAFGDESEEDEDDSESEEDAAGSCKPGQPQIVLTKEDIKARIAERRARSEATRRVEEPRSAVVCVLGHVDTGKTKILDKIRRTNVQDGEAGGITQQIGATNMPAAAIREWCNNTKTFDPDQLKLPGFLVIDTPGHESFTNLRTRGSSLCDLAILVVDIMHGLEPQTIESINLLKNRQAPFVVALNKIDRLYEWKGNSNRDIQDVLKTQKRHTKDEFDDRVSKVISEFAEKCLLNVCLYWKNDDPANYVSLCPTSAHTGDGMGNMLWYMVNFCQTHLKKRLAYREEPQATVLEVKEIHGLGTTIDVILVNGVLKEGDNIVVAGIDGPIETYVKALLAPPAMKELRVKSHYDHLKQVKAATGIKILAKDVEKALAGMPMLVAARDDEMEVLRDEMVATLANMINSIKLNDRGVYVMASTLGSLEALLEFLKQSKIPFSGINIGPVHRKDVMKASTMLDHNELFGVILAFDVKVERDAQELADSVGIKIFTAEIIYHLFDKFMNYKEDLVQKEKDKYRNVAVFPCKLRILPNCIFNSRDPIIMGVTVEAGVLKAGTPICVPTKDNLDLGTIASLEVNNKPVDSARRGMDVCIKIENTTGEAARLYGRHFDATDILVSRLSRESIDALKEYFRDEMEKTDWQCVKELKATFKIP